MAKSIAHKIKKRVRESAFTAAYRLSGYMPSAIKQAKGLRILVYHGICHSQPHLLNARFLSEQQFEEHLIAIKKQYHPVSWSDVLNNTLSATQLNILLTFDDGLKNNYTRALPLLIKHNVPAVFFISTLPNRGDYLFNDVLDVFSLIGPATFTWNGTVFKKEKRWLHERYVSHTGELLGAHVHNLDTVAREKLLAQIYALVPKEQFAAYSDYLALMSEEEIGRLSAQHGITIGSHGVTHTDLCAMSPDTLRHELNSSRHYLEQLSGKPCDTLAFPYGSYSSNVLRLAPACGYTTLFGTDTLHAAGDRAHILERFTVNPYVSAINQMYYIARQSYE